MLNRHKCLLKVAEKWAIMDANATGADMNNNFFEMCNSVLRQNSHLPELKEDVDDYNNIVKNDLK